MNIPDVGDSPWGDEPSRSPQQEESTGDGETTPVTTPQKPSATSSSAAPVRASGGRGGRTPRRFGAQTTKLESLDDDLGPLGPLGETAAPPVQDEPPQLPQKESQAPRTARPTQPPSQPSTSGREYDEESEDGISKGRYPPPVQLQAPDAARRQGQPSVSIEQAARPTFNIVVGDPHKVGDITGSHTVYQVRTKTTSKAYRQPEFEVSRRYRDFLWLYNQLHTNNPGIIVPPPPEKQAVGRFDTEFVEQRRSALERMLNKTASHLILQHDGDLKIFLESETFTIDVKAREKRDPDLLTESKGMFSGLSIGVGSSSGKFVEHDDWFLDRRIYLDTLETQLKSLLTTLTSAITQRRTLSDSCLDLSTALTNLSQVELSPSLSAPLSSLSDLHLRLRDLHARQATQDALTLATTLDEYTRLIGSIKKAFETRQKSWQLWHNAESDLQKRRTALDKLVRGGRTQQDRIGQLQADVGDAERRAHQMRLGFDDLGKGMRGELERFEREKVEDFRGAVETFLEGGVEAQKELIEHWETFLMHMDADEETAMADLAAIAHGQPPPSQTAFSGEESEQREPREAGQQQDFSADGAPSKQAAPAVAKDAGEDSDDDGTPQAAATRTQDRRAEAGLDDV